MTTEYIQILTNRSHYITEYEITSQRGCTFNFFKGNESKHLNGNDNIN